MIIYLGIWYTTVCSRAKEMIMKKQDTFEKTYKKYAFAPLVASGIRLASLIIGPAKRNKPASSNSNSKNRPAGGAIGQAA